MISIYSWETLPNPLVGSMRMFTSKPPHQIKHGDRSAADHSWDDRFDIAIWTGSGWAVCGTGVEEADAMRFVATGETPHFQFEASLAQFNATKEAMASYLTPEAPK